MDAATETTFEGFLSDIRFKSTSASRRQSACQLLATIMMQQMFVPAVCATTTGALLTFSLTTHLYSPPCFLRCKAVSVMCSSA